MRTLREWVVRLCGVIRPRRTDADLEAELRTHLEMEAEHARRAGGSAHAARRAAVLRVGEIAQAMEPARDQRGLSWLRDLARDIRFGLRVLRKEPVFSAVAVLSLALGIGANTAVFSLVDAVLLRTLPVDRPHSLFFLDVVGSDGGGGAPPYPCFDRFRRETTAFTSISAFATDQLKLTIDGSIEQVFGQVASGNYFETLGITPAMGRLLTEADELADANVAVIGYGFWQRRFAGNPSAIGRTIGFRDRTFTIVGVTPRGFWGLEPGRQVEVTLPITVERQHFADAGDWWFSAVARLHSSATVVAATSQVDGVFQSFMQGRDLSGLRPKFFDRMRLTPAGQGGSGLRSRFSNALYTLTVAAGLTFLIACANLGSLLLVRGSTRARELAIRLATGAGASRVFRQLLTEAALLFGCGAIVGLGLAVSTVRALTRFFAIGRNPILLDVPIDWRLAAFALAIAAVGAAATASWPALRAIRANPQAALQEGERRVAGSRRTSRVTQVLVVAQVAMALVLLVTALFFARTMQNLRTLDLGFDGTGVLTMSVDPSLAPTATAATRPELLREMLDRVRAIPGVRAASLSVFTPLSGRDTSQVVETSGPRLPEEIDRILHVDPVSEDYFRTFGMQIVAGRALTAEDGSAARKVIVLNEAAARWFFRERSPLGEQVRFSRDRAYEVVGVVRDFKHRSLREAPTRFAFLPLWQPLNALSRVTLSLSSALPAGMLVRDVDREVRGVYPDVLISEVMPVQDQIDATLVAERLVSGLAMGFAALALVLAGVGVYGVLSYSVAQRRVELGIRSALGASPRRLAATVTRHVFVEFLIGAVIGLPLSVGAVRLARGLLYGVEPTAPAEYVLGCVVLVVVALLAAARPARRAWSIDPAETLKRG